MNNLKQYRDVLELAYFISGTILSLGIIFTAWQVVLMKKDIKDTNKRVALEKTIEIMSKFSDDIIPTYINYLREIKNKNIYRKCNNYNFQYANSLKMSENELKVKEGFGAYKIANQLEIFASMVCNNMIDNELAFSQLSVNFCEATECVYDVICYCRLKSKKQELFENTRYLYIKWKCELIDK